MLSFFFVHDVNFNFIFFQVIIDAPHQIPLGEQNPNNEQDCLSWWFSGENPDYFSSKHLSNYVKGYDESMKKICDSFEKMVSF